MRRDSPRYGNFPKRRKSRERPWNRASPAFGKLWEHVGKYRVDLKNKYYKQYEQLINQIVTSQHMTFFDKADLLEKMDEDLQKKLAMVKGYDISC